MRLTLLIPELLWSEPGDSDVWSATLRSPAASLLAARAPTVGAPCAWEHAALRLAGLPDATSLAALRVAGEEHAPPFEDGDDARWLCADPVHLRFHQDRLILADASELALDSAELDQLVESLNAQLAPARLFFAEGGRGYLRLPSAPAAAQQPLSRKVGCEVRPGDLGTDPAVRRLANEIQMLLHAHPVNLRREANRQPPLNALWLWGAGASPQAPQHAPPPCAWIMHGSRSALVTGITRRTGAPCQVASADAAPSGGDAVVFSDRLLRAAQYQDGARWSAAWREVDAELLAPALARLRAGAISGLDVVTTTAFGELRWSITPGHARLARFLSFFRRSNATLSSLAADLAARTPPPNP